MLTDKHTQRIANNPRQFQEEPLWKQMYIKGSLRSVVGFVFDTNHIGMQFPDVAKSIYNSTLDEGTPNILIACQDSKGVVKVFPRSYIIEEGDVGFAICSSVRAAARTARLLDPDKSGRFKYSERNLMDYKPLYRRKQSGMSQESLRKDLLKFVFEDSNRKPDAQKVRRVKAK